MIINVDAAAAVGYDIRHNHQGQQSSQGMAPWREIPSTGGDPRAVSRWGLAPEGASGSPKGSSP